MAQHFHVVVAFLICAGLGLSACGPPSEVIDWADQQLSGVLFQVEAADRVVALTIDDGPDEDTAAILDVLNEHDARATFFVIGQDIQKYPDLTRRMVAEGHELGHHTMHHEPGTRLPADTFAARFDAMHDLLQEYSLQEDNGSRWFRPADGIYTPEMQEIVEGRGYQIVLGSVYPVDPANPLVPYLAGYILNNVSPGDIIILHTGQGRGKRTAEVLSRILPVLNDRGYRVTTISELVDSTTS